MIPQREPRDDQKRDKDVIRRYEMASDIDGSEVVPHIDGNVLSLHEPADTDFKKPKFKFVFKDEGDLAVFVWRLGGILDIEIKKWGWGNNAKPNK